ncbi:glycosyltransferase [Dokdonella sp.]|uniref:glycosyltransferase n=1 Tax=Dokdonella sp. TaxID=2291710 RepID=UPI002F3F0386
MARLYIDLTTSIRWRRPPVGIVRVEREFARYCLLHEPDTVFCEIDAAGDYRAIEPARARAILDDGWCRAEPVAPIGTQVATAAPVRGRVQRMFDWLAARGPKLVPAAAYPLLRDLGRVLAEHHAAFVRHRAAKKASRDATPPPESQPTTEASRRIEPAAQDLFFSIGLQWHHGAVHAWRLKQRTGVRVVEACYDTIPIDFPEYAGSAKQPFAEHFTTIAHTADVVFAISDTTKADLAAFYRRVGLFEVPPIRTVHLATPDVHRDADVGALGDDERAALDTLGERDYVLYVSTFETRKNHRMLLQVWKELHRRRGEACPALVVVGMFGWGVNDLWAEMQASEVWQAGRIVMLHHVSDALLAHLYRRCAFTVFPSIYEGWGLAATESLAYGKLAIVSDAPALREATQGLCPSIHPFDFPRWYETIAYYLDDADARAVAESRIRATYVPRHWSDFALDLLAAARARP